MEPSAEPVGCGGFTRRPVGRWRPGAGAADQERLGRQVGEGPAGRQIPGPGEVDRVVALVHARRLEEVDGVGERRMAEQVARPRAPIWPAPRCSCRSVREPSSDRESLRWTMTSRSSPIRVVEVGEEGVDGVRVGDVDPGAPGVGGVEAERKRPRATPARGDRLGDGGQLLDARAQAEAAAGRVLEDDRGPLGTGRSVVGGTAPSTSARTSADAVGEPPDARLGRRLPRCDPMWTLTNRPRKPGAVRSSLARRRRTGRRSSRPGRPG